MAALECKLSLSLITMLPIVAAPVGDKRRGLRHLPEASELNLAFLYTGLGSFSICGSCSGKPGEESCKDEELTTETGKPSMI